MRRDCEVADPTFALRAFALHTCLIDRGELGAILSVLLQIRGMMRLMPDATSSTPDRDDIAPEIIRVATTRLCASQTFASAKQQQVLLRFLVDEALEGRTSAEAQAAAVETLFADRSPEEGRKKLRWAMARLDEKLSDYYGAEGAEDPLRFAADAAGNGLTFQIWEGERLQRQASPHHVSLRLLAPLAGLVAALGIGVVLIFQSQDATVSAPVPEQQVQNAPAQKTSALPPSLAPLSAPDLEMVARDRLYPFLNLDGQRQSVAIAKAAIARDPEYALAYATASYGLATTALITTGGAMSRRYLVEARAMRDKALSMAPEDAWVLSAAALTAYAERDHDQAVAYSEKAFATAPQDVYVSGSYGVLALVTGRYAESREATRVGRLSGEAHVKFGMERLYAFASFHTGHYGETIERLTQLEASGEPHNVISVMYLAAAFQATNDHGQANAMVRRIRQEWPTFRPERIASIFFHDPDDAGFLMRNLAAAGWSFYDDP